MADSDPLARLTPRERECLALVAEHWRTKDIARRLGLAPRTVDEYVASCVRKLGVQDRHAAARLYLGLPAEPAAAAGEAPPAPRRGFGEVAARGLALAARCSLMTGAALAGLVLLTNALNTGLADGRGGLRAVLDVVSWLLWPAIVVGCGVAFWKGGRAERLAVVLYVVAVAVTQALEALAPHRGAAFMALDAVLAVGLGFLAWRHERPALLAASAFQSLAALTHLGAMLRPQVGLYAYYSVVVAWSCLALAAIVWSALARPAGFTRPT